jgi:hypothetical protein
LDSAVEGFLAEMETKASKTEYGRFQKRVCRTSFAKVSESREAKLVSAISKNHAYLLIVSYPTTDPARAKAKRFFDSVRFED